MVLPDCRIPFSIFFAKRRTTSFTRVLDGGKSVHFSPRFRPHIFSGQSVEVDFEGGVFRPRAMVRSRGVVAACTCILAKNVATKSKPWVYYMQ